jgi:hypothetical protein
MDLEGNLILDRKPARRWVSAIAVIIPVVACVAGVTWFVRAFISPPTIAIPGPMVLATVPSARPLREEPRAPEPAPPPAVTTRPAGPASAAAPAPPSSSLPMLATLSAAPPATSPAAAAGFSTPAAFTDPGRDSAMPATSAVVEAASVPITGPVPIPRPRPELTAVVTAHAVPMPRARPAEEEAPAISGPQPAYDRHPID